MPEQVSALDEARHQAAMLQSMRVEAGRRGWRSLAYLLDMAEHEARLLEAELRAAGEASTDDPIRASARPPTARRSLPRPR